MYYLITSLSFLRGAADWADYFACILKRRVHALLHLTVSARDIWAREFKPQQSQYCPTIRILVHIRIPSRKLRGNFAGIFLRITNSSFQARKTVVNSKHTVFHKGIAMFPTKAIILVLLSFGNAGKIAFKCYAITAHEI